MDNNIIKIGNKEFVVTADTFRAIANLKKYSRNVSILKFLLGTNILGVGAIVGCTAMGVTIPYLLGVAVLGCGIEFGLLCRNDRNKNMAIKLKNHFSDSIKNIYAEQGSSVNFSTTKVKFERISPHDGRIPISMTARVGEESSSRKATISCKAKVGKYDEIYRVSSNVLNEPNKTIGFFKVTTEVEPLTELTADANSCVKTIKASAPKYEYVFYPANENNDDTISFLESLQEKQQKELQQLETVKESSRAEAVRQLGLRLDRARRR